MKLSKFIRPFFPTLIVGVELDHRNCYICVKSYKNGELKETTRKEFQTVPGELPISAVRFLNRLKTTHPFTYISTFTYCIIQGALNTPSEKNFSAYGIRPSDINYQVFDNEWSAFVSKSGLADTKKRFLKIGVDFAISPFSVLYALAKDTFQDACKLFVLFQRTYITMIITKPNASVLFGGYYVLESEIDSELSSTKSNLSEDLDDIAEENVSGEIADELSEIDEMDNDDDEELIEVLKGDEEGEESEKKDGKKEGNFDDFSRASTAAKHIQHALSEFYHGDNYKGEFVQEIVIFNPHDIPEATLQYIQNITMLDIKIMPCNIAESLSDLGYESYKYFASKGQV